MSQHRSIAVGLASRNPRIRVGISEGVCRLKGVAGEGSVLQLPQREQIVRRRENVEENTMMQRYVGVRVGRSIQRLAIIHRIAVIREIEVRVVSLISITVRSDQGGPHDDSPHFCSTQAIRLIVSLKNRRFDDGSPKV